MNTLIGVLNKCLIISESDLTSLDKRIISTHINDLIIESNERRIAVLQEEIDAMENEINRIKGDRCDGK